MAERVHANVEKFSIDSEKLTSLGIFNSDEVKSMMKERTEMEYKISKRKKKYSDHITYIKYELKFYADLKNRLNEMEKENSSAILFNHEKRIHFLFRRSIPKFKDELHLWFAHFQFCIDSENFPILESSISNFVRLHFSQPKIWVESAHWYNKVESDMAKKLIEKGLSVHPTSIKILKAYLDQLVQYGSLDLTEIIDIYHDYLNKTNHSSRFFKPAFATLADKFERSKIIDLLVKSHNFHCPPEYSLFIVSHLCEFSHAESITFSKMLLNTNSAFAIQLVDILVQHKDNLQNISSWKDMLCLCYNESKCESLLCKLFLFSSEFGCPLDSDFINNIFMKTLSWSTHSQYLATFYKNISSTEAYNTFWDTFNKYPHNSSDIIELIVKSISFFQDYNYCINCIQLIEKNHINLIFLYISSGFEILLKLTNYPQVKDLVKKYLHKSTITEKLVYNIRINEYLVPEPDFVFIRSLFEKYISMKRTPSVDFWIEYISFEYYVIKNSKIWGIDYASNLYSRVIKTLSGSSVQEFVSRFSLLQANK